jgi:hypothetical protein
MLGGLTLLAQKAGTWQTEFTVEWFAPGIGMLKDGKMVLVKFEKPGSANR